jgi:hypothetical protein
MPALTYPDQLTYYAFSREIHPVFAKALNAVPVDPAPMIEQATFIKSLAEGIDSHSCEEKQAIWDRQYELAEELEAKLKAIAIYTASIVLSFDGSDFLGNSRPYDCEAISEPFSAESPSINRTTLGKCSLLFFAAERYLNRSKHTANWPSIPSLKTEPMSSSRLRVSLNASA